jgi:ribosomal protein S18 acetylase RimI-like enzyme
VDLIDKKELRLSFVKFPHAICESYTITRRTELLGAGVPLGAYRFFAAMTTGTAERAVLATYQGKIVGALRFDFAVKTDGTKMEEWKIQACGTWVSHKFRRMGIGRRLWRKLANWVKSGNTSIHVICVSKKSYRMVMGVSVDFHRISWDIEPEFD